MSDPKRRGARGTSWGVFKDIFGHLGNSLARVAGVPQRAQFLQRLSVLRSVQNLLRPDDVVERCDRDTQAVDLNLRGVLGELLVAQELPTTRQGDAEQDVDVACCSSLRADLETVNRAGVDLELERLDRAFADLQARP